MTSLHPVLPLILGAVLMPFLPVLGRQVVSLLATVAATAFLLALPVNFEMPLVFAGLPLSLIRADALSLVFALAFAIYGVIAAVFAWTESGRVEKLASLLLVAGGLGVSLAGDLITLFVFWEWLSVASLLLIWRGNSQESLAAGYRYIIFHVFGGMCFLGGILLLASETGSVAFESIAASHGTAATVLMLVGLLTNAAVIPLHAWLPDAYPRASIYGTVFLSAFTTKAAVYALARIFPGTELLVWLGASMTLFGVVFAVLENNIRRLLSYHIISQVGYMVTGVGLGTALAINGTAAHAFSHIFYKGLLMMSAGAVIFATGKERLSDLGGLAGPLRLTLIFCMIGAFSIAGAPYFNGYISKSIIVSAAAYEKRGAIELMLIVASMGTFLSIGLKLAWLTFFGGDSAKNPAVLRAVPKSMYFAMAMASVICIGTGMFPGYLYDLLPHADARYQPFTADHFVQAMQLLIGTALGFWILRGKLKGEPTITFDVDRLYRKPLALILEVVSSSIARVGLISSSFGTRMVDTSWTELVHFSLKPTQTTISFHAILVFISAGVLAVLAFLN